MVSSSPSRALEVELQHIQEGIILLVQRTAWNGIAHELIKNMTGDFVTYASIETSTLDTPDA